MKKLFFYLLPLLAAGWLLPMGGCKVLDDSENRYKPPAGMVLEFGTEKPIPGAQVLLLDYNGEFMGGHGFTELDNQLSDQNGAYDFKTVGFLVTAKKDGYFTNDLTGEIILSGSERHTDIHLYPHAWMKVTLKNQSGAYGFSGLGVDDTYNGGLIQLAQGQDSTFVTFTKGNTDYKYVFSAIPFESPYVDYDFGNLSISDKSGSIEYSKITNNGGYFNVPLTGHDTTSITITY